MKPYYETPLGKLYHGDCLEIMPQLEPVGVIITSPPYNLGNNHHTNRYKHNPYDDDLPEDEYQALQMLFLLRAYAVLDVGGWLFYNHKHRIKKGVLIKPDKWVGQSMFIEKQEIVWNNGSPNMDKIRFFPFTERIYCLAKDDVSEIYNRENLTDDWHFQGARAMGQAHTRGFPTKIPMRLLNAVSNPYMVLDPYLGSGTTAIACERLKRKWIGIEILEKYCEIAAKRIEAERKQRKLF